MATAIKYPTSTNAVQKTLGAQLLAGATTSMTLNNVVGIQNKAGVCVVDRVDANGNATASKREYITFTGVSGSTLTGLTRNADGGGTDQDHAVGAIVEFVSDVLQQQAIIDGLLLTVTTAGALNKAAGSDVTTGTDDAKIVTCKAIKDAGIVAVTVPVKATGAELDTGTDDAKFSTAKALKDSHNVPSVAPSTSGNILTSDGTDWTSATPPVASTGWTADTDTWVYVSASTFKVAGKNVTTKFTKGTRLKFTQTSAKYAVVVASSFSTDTTITILVNIDYTIANDAITSPYYSYQMNPQGYPGWFNVAAPTWNVSLIDNGSGGQPTTTTHKIAINGNTLEGWIHGSGTKAGANWYFGYTNPYGVTPLFTRGIGACNAYWASTDYSGVVNYDGLIYLAFESDRGISDNQAIAGFFARFSFQF